ncbi:alanine racemase [Guggenheimella bovis]
MYPRIVIDKEKYRQNVRMMKEKLAKKGIALAAVTKVFCAEPALVDVLVEEGVDYIADSRIENLKKVGPRAKRLLLRLPMLSQVEEVVAHSEMALVSEVETLIALEMAAKKLQKKYEVLVMIDLGDLREGVLEKDVDSFFSILPKFENLSIKGIGTNLTCFGGILPTKEALTRLLDVKKHVEATYHLELPIVSGGNSSSLYLLDEDGIPEGINLLRLGESLVLGNDTALLCPIEGLHRDIFTLEAELVEMKTKPSKPWGKQGADAFGNFVTFEDKGPMKRGILAVGKQDVNFSGLTPRENVECIGSSSDHLLLDLKMGDYHLGDIFTFDLDYGALLQLMTSPYVEKAVK